MRPADDLTARGRNLEDAAILRRLAREAEAVLARYTVPTRIARVPEHLRCQAYAIDPSGQD